MKVVWTQRALDELGAIHERISETSGDYANRTVDRITRRAGQLALFPNSGRTVPEFSIPVLREVVEAPYRLIYRAGDTIVEILAVIHGARSV